MPWFALEISGKVAYDDIPFGVPFVLTGYVVPFVCYHTNSHHHSLFMRISDNRETTIAEGPSPLMLPHPSNHWEPPDGARSPTYEYHLVLQYTWFEET